MGETRASLHGPGSVIRAALLVALALVVAPAVVADGDALAAPAVALVLLAGIGVAVVGLAYWLLTTGAPAAFLTRRLRLTRDRIRIGMACVIGLAAAAGLAWFRLQVHHRRSPLAQFDLRALATAHRLDGEHHLMQALNTVGIRSMIVLGTMLAVAAIATRAIRSGVLLAAAMAAGGGLVELLKLSPLRPLPALGEAASQHTSWPSGHAALQCSLAFGVVLWWWAADLPRPSVVAAIVLPFAVLVGYSRAYLDIHLLSDVLAGWLVAVIASALVVVVDRFVAIRLTISPPRERWRVVVAGIVALAVTGVAVGVDRRIHDRGPRHFPGEASGALHGFREPAVPEDPTRLATADPAAVLGMLPRFSETLLGRRALPLGLVVFADHDGLGVALGHAGWTPARVFTPERLPRDFWSGLTSWTGLVGGVGAGEPVAPTFFDTRAPDIVARRRSADAELWQLPVETAGGCVVWGITTARVDRTTIGWRTLLPRRRIAPAIDAERDALAEALAATRDFVDAGRFRFMAPTNGKGSRGAFVTDGKVAVLRQRGCS